MKCTIVITQRCNLSCDYCYVPKRPATMSRQIAGKIVEFAYRHAPPGEPIHFGFFGGEPLLEFDAVKTVTQLIEDHRSFDPGQVTMTVVTNGTVFSDEIADFIVDHKIGFGISCDGAPGVHDRFRRYPGGAGSLETVKQTIRRALGAFGRVIVNAVYHPLTLQNLPDTIRFLSSLGVRQIYLNPDYSAAWRERDASIVDEVYRQVAEQYVEFYLAGRPHFISLIDSKIAVILRGGYQPHERCRMGNAEFAFTPSGFIYPCERLLSGGDDGHCIGHVDSGLRPLAMSCHMASGSSVNAECLVCSLRDYCMNWCGCSNYFASGYYNRVSGFICASEKAAIRHAAYACDVLQDAMGAAFAEHASGYPLLNSVYG